MEEKKILRRIQTMCLVMFISFCVMTAACGATFFYVMNRLEPTLVKLEEAAENIGSVDTESLNETIGTLNDAVSALGKVVIPIKEFLED